MMTLEIDFEGITGSYEGLTTSTITARNDQNETYHLGVMRGPELYVADIYTGSTTVRFKDHGTCWCPFHIHLEANLEMNFEVLRSHLHRHQNGP